MKHRVVMWGFGVFLVCATVAVTAGIAVAAFPDSDVHTYTGCLGSGTVTSLRQGDAPAQPCPSQKQTIKLSGGDITKVAATGALTGGGENGAVSIGLPTGNTVPANCSVPDVPKWNGMAWECGTDNDPHYRAGTGLDLSGAVEFEVEPGYRLPQSCANGAVPKSNGQGSWSCGSDDVGTGPTTYYARSSHVVESAEAGQEIVGFSDLPAGNYVIWVNVHNTPYQTSSGEHSHGMACGVDSNPPLGLGFGVRENDSASDVWAGNLAAGSQVVLNCILDVVHVGDDNATLATATVTAMRVGSVNP